MDVDARQRNAVHEAGHAVIGRVLGLPCGEVALGPSAGTDADVLGYAVIGDPRFHWERGDGPRRVVAEDFCIALYAGAEAERLVHGSTETGDSEDVARAEACMSWVGVRGAAFVGDDAYDRYGERLRRRGRQLVAAHRLKIEKVAEALLAAGKLTRDEVDQLVS